MSGNQASGRRMTEKAKIICPPPSGVDIIPLTKTAEKTANNKVLKMSEQSTCQLVLTSIQ